MRLISIPASRGIIYDRNHHPLAVSSPVVSVWVNPQQFSSDDPGLPQLAKLLGEKPKTLQKRLEHAKGREFVYLKRQMEPSIGKEIQALAIPGVYLQREYRRFYPDGEVAAHVIGFTNIDEKGQEGVELAFEQTLQGIPGEQRVVKDRLGHVVAVVDEIAPARPGQDVVLSLDHRIQYLAYRELKKAVQEHQAASGSIVVLDAKTGEVLAMVNQPSYNPNSRIQEPLDHYRNRAVTDVFEPGSTIKTFSVMNALESGRYKPSTKVDIRPGWMTIGNRVFNEEHYHEGILDVATVLQKSSNLGVAKISLDLPPDSLWKLLHRLGFGETTTSGFPGEVSGSLPFQRKFTPITIATLSYGYGLATTTLQLAASYAILAAGGIKNPVTLQKQEHPVKGERVVSKKTTSAIMKILETVLDEGGTATRARVPGYRIVGKTGTVRQITAQGYDKNHHEALFVGIAPATDPQLVIAVVINDPQGKFYYGGLVAAPVFSKVMEGALRTLNIPPDDFSNINASNDAGLVASPLKQGALTHAE